MKQCTLEFKARIEFLNNDTFLHMETMRWINRLLEHYKNNDIQPIWINELEIIWQMNLFNFHEFCVCISIYSIRMTAFIWNNVKDEQFGFFHLYSVALGAPDRWTWFWYSNMVSIHSIFSILLGFFFCFLFGFVEFFDEYRISKFCKDRKTWTNRQIGAYGDIWDSEKCEIFEIRRNDQNPKI